ncbi:hypothetical protein BRADI_3g37171v3 [Brachypodium distachyon]|uniref:Uncharacterized protein n=2 Tax=Brachypodium distachyon TaxID=15368 RepID=A0A0Q3FGX5_BRADI|nr:hypothetical protein BRADI_3g37171v3 [Brachypodium distachyon]
MEARPSSSRPPVSFLVARRRRIRRHQPSHLLPRVRWNRKELPERATPTPSGFLLLSHRPGGHSSLPPLLPFDPNPPEPVEEEAPKPLERESEAMEKKDLLGVRSKPAATKRRRKVAAGGGSRWGIAKAVAEYLASDSYMYAPLVSDPQQPPPPPAAAPATGSPEKEVTLVQKYRGSWRSTFAAC